MYIRYDDYSYADEDVAADYDYHFYVNSRLVSKNDNTWNFTTLRSETSIYKYPTVKSLILYDGKAKSFIQSAASVSGDQTVYYGVSTSQNSQPTNWYSDIDDLKVTATGEYYLWIKTDGNKTYKALSPTRCDKITVSNQASTFENYYFGNSDGTQSNPFVISDEEDWDFLLSLINKDDIVYRIPKVLLQYRIKQVSKSVSEVPANRDALTWQIINNHPDIYRDFLFDSITHNERYNSTEKLERSIGHAVTKPVRLLRKLIHGIKSFAADFKYKRSI